MSEDNKALAPKVKESVGRLHQLFGHGAPERSETDNRSGPTTGPTTLDLG